MSEFKKYIGSILDDVILDAKSRKDIADEIEDHLNLTKEELIGKGYTENEAVSMAINSFGEVKKIKNKYALTLNPFSRIIRKSAGILFVPYVLLIIKLAFFNLYSQFGYRFSSINPVPLKSIAHYLFNFHRYNFDIWFNNLFGIMIAFIPFGFLIPIIHNRTRRIRDVIIVTIAFSALVEALQYITRRGSADIDDIILSTVGGIIGFIILKLFVKFILLLKKSVSNNNAIVG